MEDIKIASDNTIENYIQRVTELCQSGRKTPSPQELEKIVSEVGITAEEISLAQTQSQANFARAKGYISLRHWDDAIGELEEGLAFDPYNISMIHCLISSYFGRWRENHHPEDEQRIRKRIKQCLEIKPDDEESLQLLGKLTQSIKNRQLINLSLGLLGILSIGTMIGLFTLNRISLDFLNNNTDEKIENMESNLRSQMRRLDNESIRRSQDLSQKIINQENMTHSFYNRIRELEQINQKLQNDNQVLLQNNDNLNKRLEIVEQQMQQLEQENIILPE
ncbi:hypothetical protein IQ215_05730 [Cyanobacterium stanieri LEGE 03274]|uniref:Tetratricopeptide repeat protein n=1 Tax=Cyanobacterium stanieri LEGE 03274 TaxID=1828756 RepID=A0ABR9V2S3_9CHRO|nr:hypothetical protein [Cyanobacterium stanieri]MBE9222193.1 hypothetical protein [Cyanobacterium stanieri LEGE 03274]